MLRKASMGPKVLGSSLDCGTWARLCRSLGLRQGHCSRCFSPCQTQEGLVFSTAAQLRGVWRPPKPAPCILEAHRLEGRRL